MPDAGISRRQDMLAKQPKELIRFHGGGFASAVVSVVRPCEGYLSRAYLLDAVIGYCRTVGIAPQVFRVC
jgi:hypothetical protein